MASILAERFALLNDLEVSEVINFFKGVREESDDE